MTALPLAVTCGDPAGVGPEVIAAWLKSPPATTRELVILGPRRWLQDLPADVQRQAVVAATTGSFASPQKASVHWMPTPCNLP